MLNLKNKQGILVLEVSEKIKVLQKAFFPKLLKANLSNT
jgi:hypothetical protein